MGMGCTGRWYIGGGVKYPVELAARLLKAGRKADPGDVKLLIHETKKIHDEYGKIRATFEDLIKELEIAEHTVRLLQVSDE